MNRSAQDIDWSRSAIYLSKESSLGREEMLRPNVVQIPAEALALELGPQGHPLGDVQLPLQLSRLCGSDRAGFNYPNCPSSIVVTRRIDSEFYKHFLNFTVLATSSRKNPCRRRKGESYFKGSPMHKRSLNATLNSAKPDYKT